MQRTRGLGASGAPIRTEALAFSASGRYLAIGRGQAGLVVWDTQTGELHSVPGPVVLMDFLPKTNVILFSHHSGFARWDVERGTLRQLGSDGPYGFKYGFPAFSPDGRRVAAARGDNSIGIWNARTLELDAPLAWSR